MSADTYRSGISCVGNGVGMSSRRNPLAIRQLIPDPLGNHRENCAGGSGISTSFRAPEHFLGYIIGRGVTFGNVPPYSYGRGIAYEPLVLIEISRRVI